MQKKRWETYEEVAQHLLNKFKSEFNLINVEEKQKVSGHKSGTNYEIDAKGVKIDGESIIIVECRRYTKSKQSQEKLGAIAYKIYDAGAVGGIIVSPLGLQKGAKKIAEAENIISVKLNEDCTTENYILQFLNMVMVGVSADFTVKSDTTIKYFKI